MLAMIEVNLLPVEFRPREKTNLPLIMTIAAGLLVCGVVVLIGLNLSNELAELNQRHRDLTEKKTALEQEVKEVRGLKEEIARAKARQTTIIEISQSKIMWSLKLQQFSHLINDFPGFWVQRLTLNKSAKGSSLVMTTSATGSSLREVARFRDALLNDPNFFYHFSGLESDQVVITPLPAGYNYAEKMDFTVTLPLAAATPAVDPKAKKRRK